MQFRNRLVPKKGLKEIIADCYKYYTNLDNLSEDDLDTIREMYGERDSRDELARIYGSERPPIRPIRSRRWASNMRRAAA